MNIDKLRIKTPTPFINNSEITFAVIRNDDDQVIGFRVIKNGHLKEFMVKKSTILKAWCDAERFAGIS